MRVDAEFGSASGLWLSVNPTELFKIEPIAEGQQVSRTRGWSVTRVL